MQLRKWMIVGVTALAFACGKDENNNNKTPADTGDENNTTDMGSGDTGDNNENNENNNNGMDMGNPEDMPDPVDMTDPEDMGDDMSETDMAGDMGDMGGDMGGPCTYNSFMPSMEVAEASTDPDLPYFRYNARDMTLSSMTEFGYMIFELFPDFGATVGPQTFTFTGENYNACHTCLLIDLCTVGQGTADCPKTFLVDSGTVEITAMGSNQDDAFTATFTDMEFIEVTIADDGSFTSTPVPNGDTWCFNTMDASAMTDDVTP